MNRKQEILDHALDRFTNIGYHQVSMKDIALGLSIKRTTLYDYFRSKEEIVLQLIESMFESYPSSETLGAFLNRIEMLTDYMLTKVSHHLDIYRLLFTALPALDEQMQAKISEWQKPFFEEMDDIFKKNYVENNEKIKFVYRALISTKVSDYISSKHQINKDEDVKMIVDIMKGHMNDE